MDARQQRIFASARDISAWCRVVLMKRAAERGEALLDEGSADEEPKPRNALMLHERGE
jgi:hypothetical protein